MTTLKTAVCIDTEGNNRLVHCKVAGHPNSPDVENLDYTKKVLKADHPELEFVDWVYDLEADRSAIGLCFLSPCVFSVKKWVFTDNGVEELIIHRKEVL